jgi:hypothetical protein
MKEATRWKLMAGIVLVTLTLFLMTIHYLIFQDSHYLMIYLFADLAFVPVEVLCVTLIIDSMLSARERQERMEKLNMVIGIFFSRVGTPLLPASRRPTRMPGPCLPWMPMTLPGTQRRSGLYRLVPAAGSAGLIPPVPTWMRCGSS